mmetsp:Transcript_96511/g.242088  ORF Transcript_96511/g.242088 Transcript_96511/m.242088 type:complete len:252 (-) Transcript_96511:435-1190(-)
MRRQDVEVKQDVGQVRLDPVHSLHDPVQVRLHHIQVRVQDANDSGNVGPQDREPGVDRRKMRHDGRGVRQDGRCERWPDGQGRRHGKAGSRLIEEVGPGVLRRRHASEENLHRGVGDEELERAEEASASCSGILRRQVALDDLHERAQARQHAGVDLDLRHLAGVVSAALLQDLPQPTRVHDVDDGRHPEALRPLLVRGVAHEQGGVHPNELEGLLPRAHCSQSSQHFCNILRLDEQRRGIHLDDAQGLLL